MASLGMNGPFDLDEKTINSMVTKKSAGNYALGRINDEGTFLVGYVGRSDQDINGRLKNWVDETKYSKFKFSYAFSPKAAFENECKNYHDFDPPLNDSHPDRPNDTNWKCPRCNIY